MDEWTIRNTWRVDHHRACRLQARDEREAYVDQLLDVLGAVLLDKAAPLLLHGGGRYLAAGDALD